MRCDVERAIDLIVQGCQRQRDCCVVRVEHLHARIETRQHRRRAAAEKLHDRRTDAVTGHRCAAHMMIRMSGWRALKSATRRSISI